MSIYSLTQTCPDCGFKETGQYKVYGDFDGWDKEKYILKDCPVCAKTKPLLDKLKVLKQQLKDLAKSKKNSTYVMDLSKKLFRANADKDMLIDENLRMREDIIGWRKGHLPFKDTHEKMVNEEYPIALSMKKG